MLVHWTIKVTILCQKQFGGYVVSGADWETQLKLWNVCHVEFGYNETVCENLDDPAYEDIEVEVQQRVNNFQV